MIAFKGKNVLITAGPTQEALDPVRYLSNHSSGKMGFALAEAFLDAGAQVVLVTGPVQITLEHRNLTLLHITSAEEMLKACSEHFHTANVCIFAAAVADYRPAHMADQKIKKAEDFYDLRLVKTIDIALEFGKIKKTNQLSVGFALETNNLLENARSKLVRKNMDFIVLNTPNDSGSAFGFDTNKVTLISKNGLEQSYPLKSKKEVAAEILYAISAL